MNRVIFEGKPVGETAKVVFDFTSRLAIGESISSASTVATVYSGTDSTPSALISGAANISGAQVTQVITGGVAGTMYELTCTVVTSTSQRLTLTGYQVVV